MRDYQLIEPSPIRKLQMNRSSSLYEVYVNHLKTYNRVEAVERTKEYAMVHYSKELSEQMASMEFLYMNDLFGELRTLVNREEIHGDVRYLYTLLVERLNEKVTLEQLSGLRTLQFSHPSLHCLHLFTLVYSYYDLKIYTALDKYLDDCDQALQSVDEPLMYYYLNQRYQELLFQHYWKTDNPVLASRYGYKMINTEVSPRKKSQMYHNLALSKLFNGYESSMEPIYKSLEIAKEHELNPFINAIKQHTIPFISAFHHRLEGVVTKDPVENAHLALARGDYEETRKILSSLPSLTPFQESYLGLATQDVDLLKHAYKRFIHERGDHFFARVPLEYLNRMKSSN